MLMVTQVAQEMPFYFVLKLRIMRALNCGVNALLAMRRTEHRAEETMSSKAMSMSS